MHKKRAASGCERPKSREETPKEGSGSSRYRTAISYLATHKNQGSKLNFLCYFCMAAAQMASSGSFHAKIFYVGPRSAAEVSPGYPSSPAIEIGAQLLTA